jgi:aerobic carbon-monoxide dehydrogenase small subunit
MPPEAMRRIPIRLNGLSVEPIAKSGQHLADLIRRELFLTGTHIGCEQGVCGACNILVDGVVVRGCLYLAEQAEGADIRTIEGLSNDRDCADLLTAFEAENALQCGFCTPGMVMTAYEMLSFSKRLNRTEIRAKLSGNICRCTGYQAIVNAIEIVARQRGLFADD